IFTEDSEEVVRSSHRYPFARSVVFIGAAFALLSVVFFGRLEFEYDFGKLEPRFPRYEEFRKMSGQITESSKRNPAYIIADSDEEVDELLLKINEIIEKEREEGKYNVLTVEALQERFPTTPEKQQAKLEHIAEIRELLKDPFVAASKDEDLDKLRKAA